MVTTARMRYLAPDSAYDDYDERDLDHFPQPDADELIEPGPYEARGPLMGALAAAIVDVEAMREARHCSHHATCAACYGQPCEACA